MLELIDNVTLLPYIHQLSPLPIVYALLFAQAVIKLVPYPKRSIVLAESSDPWVCARAYDQYLVCRFRAAAIIARVVNFPVEASAYLAAYQQQVGIAAAETDTPQPMPSSSSAHRPTSSSSSSSAGPAASSPAAAASASFASFAPFDRASDASSIASDKEDAVGEGEDGRGAAIEAREGPGMLMKEEAWAVEGGVGTQKRTEALMDEGRDSSNHSFAASLALAAGMEAGDLSPSSSGTLPAALRAAADAAVVGNIAMRSAAAEVEAFDQ